MQVWDTQTGEELHTLEGHKNVVSSCRQVPCSSEQHLQWRVHLCMASGSDLLWCPCHGAHSS